MNPKAKAKELFDKYWLYLEPHDYSAKQCAIIAVKEARSYLDTDTFAYNYLGEVIKEIERL